MSYFRRGMGDGPITDPCQVDPSTCPVVVPPAATPPANTGGPLGWLLGLIRSDVAAATPSAPSADMADGTKMLLAGAVVVAGYYLLRKKR